MTGRFNSDLGAVIEMQPSLLNLILQFRESAAGVSFRREVSECLMMNEGSELRAAINSGLRQALTVSALERARDQLCGLFVLREAAPRVFPAFWGDLRNAEERIAGWRRLSKSLLDDVCNAGKLSPYDTCPCGSGEKVKFCCSAALRWILCVYLGPCDVGCRGRVGLWSGTGVLQMKEMSQPRPDARWQVDWLRVLPGWFPIRYCCVQVIRLNGSLEGANCLRRTR